MQKIMLNEPFGLQQATFDRTKTMTRRIIPKKTLNKWYEFEEHYRIAAPTDMPFYFEPMEDFLIRHAPYKVGEIVAIAQRYSQIISAITPRFAPHAKDWMRSEKGWNNKMFVKAEYMPHHIKIIKRRLEHLQDISDEDCLREGIVCKHIGDEDCYTVENFLLWDKYLRQTAFSTPYKAFEVLIRNMQGNIAWESNPLVYVYEYKLID